MSSIPRLNNIIGALEADKIAFSVFANPDIETALALSTSAYDGLVFEGEHNAWDISAIRNSLQFLLNRRQLVEGATLTPSITPFVRVPVNGVEMSQVYAKQALDLGAYGIIWPHISDVAQAYNAVAACRYPRLSSAATYEPQGIRGDGPTAAARYWGLTQQEYYQRADVWPLNPAGEIFVMLMIEDTVGISNLDDILSNVPGIGAILIGEGDLSQELGYPRQYEHPEVLAAMAQIVATCKKHNVPVGHPHVDDKNAERIISEGYRFLMAAPVRHYRPLEVARSSPDGDSRRGTDAMITVADVEAARGRLAGIVRPTPTVLSGSFTNLLGRPTYLKPEHLQRTGSFKIRGAYNCVSQVAARDPHAHVVAASAGNHAQGVALAARLCGVRATIFMPNNAALPKVAATRADGATVILGGGSVDECIERARAFAESEGAVFVSPFDDPSIIAGQGTIGLELAEEAPPLDAVLVPVGGGGLLAGVACALRAVSPATRIIGVEAAGAASMTVARRAGRPIALDHTATMADGIAIRQVSPLTLEHALAQVDEICTVEEESISRAVVMLLERQKWVVEPAGAVGVAALLDRKITGDGAVGVVLSGGNVDPLVLTRLINYGLSSAGRYLQLRVVVDDRPGSLATLTAAIAAMDLNVLGVDHHRSGTSVGVFEVEVLLTVETRDPGHRDEVVATLRAAGFTAEIRP